MFAVGDVVYPHTDLLPAMLQDTIHRRLEGIGDLPPLLQGWSQAGLQAAGVVDTHGVHTGGGAVTVHHGRL